MLLEEATLSDKAQRRLRKEEAAAAARLQAQTTAAASVAAPCIQRGDGAGGSRDVTLERVCVGNGGALLIEDATLTLAAGRRYGLVGRNGTGKTTLLRALAGRALEGLPASLSVLHVEQEVRGGAESVLECVLACDAERSALLAESAALQQQAEAGSGSGCGGGGATRLGAVFERLEAIDAAGAPARAATILAGLSFDGAQQAAPTASFSGGWRMRISLARALYIQPTLLLLDGASSFWGWLWWWLFVRSRP